MDLKKLSAMQEILNRHMRYHFDSYFIGTSLTSTQAVTLEYIIIKSQDKNVFPKDIENFLKVKPSSVTSLVKGLERGGYLRKEGIAGDGRYKKLVPTEKALDMQGHISERITHFIESVYDGVSENDLLVFESVMAQMIKNANLSI